MEVAISIWIVDPALGVLGLLAPVMFPVVLANK
jgi:hypothetical protein